MVLLSGYRGGSLKFSEIGSLISEVEGVFWGSISLGLLKLGICNTYEKFCGLVNC